MSLAALPGVSRVGSAGAGALVAAAIARSFWRLRESRARATSGGGRRATTRSVLCRTVHADATDPDCAVVVLASRSTAALNALSHVPRNRTVSYLDIERPEFGINPLGSPADVAVAAERLTAVLADGCSDHEARDVSARYLDHAARAVIGAGRAGVIEGLPTLWDMYRILIPAETGFRGRVVESLYLDPGLVETAVWFGRELKRDLERSPRTTAAVLDHARNSILRLVTEPLDQVLRHPEPARCRRAPAPAGRPHRGR